MPTTQPSQGRRFAWLTALLLTVGGCHMAGGAASDAGGGGPAATRPRAGAPAATAAPAAGPSTPALARRASPRPVASLAPSEPFSTDVVALRDGARSVPVAVYVADTPDLRARGLMGRAQLADGTGMLFTYTDDTSGSYWMRDTLIPLSIAFFEADGEMIEMLDMTPCTTASCPRYGPDSPYRYALEVPRGWFDRSGIDRTWRLQMGDEQ